ALAREMFERATEIDPRFAGAWAGLATAHVYLHGCDNEPHLEKARQASARALELDPSSAEAHVAAGQGLSMEQRYSEAAIQLERAKECIERAQSLAPDDDAILYNAGCALAILGEQEAALDALEKAIDAGLAGGDWVPQDPDWESLRDQPRFKELVARLAAS